MKKATKWLIAYSIFFLLMLGMNYWAGTGIEQVADQEETLIQPAGYTFSIWGLIYVLLFIWIARAFFSARKEDLTQRLTFWPILNFILNSIWIVVFTQHQVGASLVVILSLLITLLVMYRKLPYRAVHWFDRLPFSIYWSWVFMATIVNLFTWFEEMNEASFLGISEELWTILFILLATLVGIAVTIKCKDIAVPLVGIWAFVGILMKLQLSPFFVSLVLVLAIVSLLVVAGIQMVEIWKTRESSHTGAL